MSTKERLLQLLEENPGEFLSGEEIAEGLGVSRAAVCKAAKALRDQGVPIDAVTRRGYCLRENADLLSQEKLQAQADPFWKIQVMDQVPSTNSLLRQLALQGAEEGTVILAQSQSAGRGRMEREFYSPRDTGLYLSLLLRPQGLTTGESLEITTMAASALCIAVEEVTGRSPQIKWVNDLMLDGRKISGILTEGALSMETGKMDFIVLGLGVNLYPPHGGFPEHLQDIAGVLCKKQQKDLKNRLVGVFLQKFLYFYRGRNFAEAAKIYRSRSILIGKEILAEGIQAKVLDVNDHCQLVVEYGDGSRRNLSYGEVSIVN